MRMRKKKIKRIVVISDLQVPFHDTKAIKNGEYEFSHYYWQWKLSELEINEKYVEYNGDIQKLL